MFVLRGVALFSRSIVLFDGNPHIAPVEWNVLQPGMNWWKKIYVHTSHFWWRLIVETKASLGDYLSRLRILGYDPSWGLRLLGWFPNLVSLEFIQTFKTTAETINPEPEASSQTERREKRIEVSDEDFPLHWLAFPERKLDKVYLHYCAFQQRAEEYVDFSYWCCILWTRCGCS